MAKEIAVLGGGCFWCLEAVYQQVRGVESVESGYTGGSVDHPSYEQVCGGQTGHAEVVKLVFDPQQITYREILEIFFTIHDPTTLNRQGNDVGTQYRSVIYYQDEQQRDTAERVPLREGASSGPHVGSVEADSVGAHTHTYRVYLGGGGTLFGRYYDEHSNCQNCVGPGASRPTEDNPTGETRPKNIEGEGEVSIRDLIKSCLRMRPDRIVVGECRGGEALDMLQAMNTGHSGSLTTLHSNNPRECISRLETLVMMAGLNLPAKAIKENIAAAVNVLVTEAS